MGLAARKRSAWRMEVGTGGVVGEEVAYGGGVELLDAVVVVDEGEDLGVDTVFGDGAGDLVLLVDVVDAGAVDDGEGLEVAGGVGDEGAIGA